MTPDAELLRRYVEQRSEAAFGEFVQRHVALVYFAARRQLGDRDEHRAREVAQSVFTDVARKAVSLQRHPAIASWLHTSTRFAATKLRRAEWRRAKYEQEAQAMPELIHAVAPAVDWQRLQPLVDELIHELAERDREAVLLRFFEGRAFAEIGEALAVSEDAARMRVDRGLEKLRALLARRGVTSTAGALGVALGSQALVGAPAGLAATIAGGALATSAGVGWITAGIFMQTTKIIAAAIVIGALGVALFQYQHARDAEKAAAALNQQRDNLAAQLREAQQRTDESAKQGSALRRDLEAALAKPIPMPLAPAANPGPVVSSNSLSFVSAPGTLSLSGADPVERARRARAQSDASVDTNYGALFAQLGWTPAQQEQFRDLMFERSQSNEKLFAAAAAAARKQNPNLDRAGMFEVFEAAQAQGQIEQEAEVRRIFGDAAGQAMAQFQSTMPMRSVARQLASELLFSGAPLAPAQAEQLIDVLAANSRGLGGRVETVALNVDAAVAQAQAQNVLNAAQLADFRKVATRMQAQAKAERDRNTSPTGQPVMQAGGPK